MAESPAAATTTAAGGEKEIAPQSATTPQPPATSAASRRRQKQRQNRKQAKKNNQDANSNVKTNLAEPTTRVHTMDNQQQQQQHTSSSNNKNNSKTATATRKMGYATGASSQTTVTKPKPTSVTTIKPQQQQQQQQQQQRSPEFSIPAVDLIRQLALLGGCLFTCMIQEAIKESIERRSIAVDYLALWLAPIVADTLMDRFVWLPHFLPGFATAAALSWVCHRIEEKDPLLFTSIGDLHNLTSSSGEQQQQHQHTGSAEEKSSIKPSKSPTNKKSKKYNNATASGADHRGSGGTMKSPLQQQQEDQRVEELRIMEAKICHSVLKNLRWSLPVVVSVVAIVQTSKLEGSMPCLRLVAAFGLSMLKTHNLFSPLSWISVSIQILILLGMQDSHTYMKRLYGLEIIIASLGLSTLRFVRLGGTSVKRKKLQKDGSFPFQRGT